MHIKFQPNPWTLTKWHHFQFQHFSLLYSYTNDKSLLNIIIPPSSDDDEDLENGDNDSDSGSGSEPGLDYLNKELSSVGKPSKYSFIHLLHLCYTCIYIYIYVQCTLSIPSL